MKTIGVAPAFLVRIAAGFVRTRKTCASNTGTGGAGGGARKRRMESPVAAQNRCGRPGGGTRRTRRARRPRRKAGGWGGPDPAGDWVEMQAQRARSASEENRKCLSLARASGSYAAVSGPYAVQSGSRTGVFLPAGLGYSFDFAGGGLASSHWRAASIAARSSACSQGSSVMSGSTCATRVYARSSEPLVNPSNTSTVATN